MRFSYLFILGCVFCAVVLLSCKDDLLKGPFPESDFYECYSRTQWDQSSVENALTGKWLWIFQACQSATATGFTNAEEIEIEFHSNGTMDVFQHGDLIKTSDWSLSPTGGINFMIKTKPSVSQVYGGVVLCDNQVQFVASYIDLCDNVFERVQ